MPPLPSPSSLSLALPLPSPIRIFFLPATPASLRSKPNPSSLPPRPSPKPPLPSSSFPLSASPTSFPYSLPRPQPTPKQEEEEEEEEQEELVIGDCLVFEEGAFEDGDPFLPPDPTGEPERPRRRKPAPKATEASESLIPEKWKEAAEELKLTKKEKRKIAQELRFGSRMERRKKSARPDVEEYMAFREMKLSQLKPVVLDNPGEFPREEEGAPIELETSSGGRVAPRNPRLGLKGGSLEEITDFFNSRDYVPGGINDDKKPHGPRKLFTKEEKVLLNKRIPNLAEATSIKWLPLHTLAASGEFYLLDMLLRHNVDINAVDKDGLSAIHKAILCKKQAIINYLLRNSANPFIRDRDGATLMHYAVQTASIPTIKILLLYNVDMNLADHDGWTPLHLAVQTKRTDIVRLLLIKGADRTLKNRDGLTAVDLCLYSGHDTRTYELIKLLKELPVPKSLT